jgi:benzodiazapine receptor
MLMPKFVKFIIALAGPFAAGAIGSLATISNIPTWYAALNKPSFSPPNWLFGPVWTTLYILMGISLYVVWTASYKDSKQAAYVAFAVQLVLNTVWSLVFFGLHLPWGGVVVIAALLVAILATVKLFWPISRLASYLLIPYILWVAFAAVLNVSVAYLN